MYKLILIPLFLFLCFGNIQAQKIQYSYDNAGNRISRMLCIGCRTINPNPPSTTEINKAEELAAKNGVHVFPNPSAGNTLTLTLDKYNSEEKTVCYLLNTEGKTLKTFNITGTSNQLDVADVGAGTYFIKIYVGKEELFYKIMKY